MFSDSVSPRSGLRESPFHEPELKPARPCPSITEPKPWSQTTTHAAVPGPPGASSSAVCSARSPPPACLVDDAHAAASQHPQDLVARHRHRTDGMLRLRGRARHERGGPLDGGRLRARDVVGGAGRIVVVRRRHRAPPFEQEGPQPASGRRAPAAVVRRLAEWNRIIPARAANATAFPKPAGGPGSAPPGGRAVRPRGPMSAASQPGRPRRPAPSMRRGPSASSSRARRRRTGPWQGPRGRRRFATASALLFRASVLSTEATKLVCGVHESFPTHRAGVAVASRPAGTVPLPRAAAG
jgi:hypothetical protein